MNLSRRHFLALAAAAPPLAGVAAHASGAPRTGKTLGVALGGGGARGLAHVEILAALDELGVRPSVIAGTSMGAVIGALYASGHTALEIKAVVQDALALRRGSLGFVRKELLEWIHLVDPGIPRDVVLSGSEFVAFIHERIKAATFAGLKTPLLVVAADIRRREQVTLHEGDLGTALAASIAFPGLYSPVVVGDRLLVDGGIVDPVPYDLLLDRCDIVVAVDVAGRRTYPSPSNLSFFDVVAESFQTMEKSILRAQMKDRPPDIYLKPDLVDIRLLDFARAEYIYRQAQPARDELKKSLERLLR